MRGGGGFVVGASGAGEPRGDYCVDSVMRRADGRASTRQFVMMNKSVSGRTLTRAALREAVYVCCPALSRADARKILDATFEEICEALARGESVKLRSFGTFNIRSKRERVGRNPKTGVEAPISPRKVLTFKASPVLAAHVNGEVHAGDDEDD